MPQNLPSKKVFAVAFLAIGVLAWSIVNQHSAKQNVAPEKSILSTIAHAESAFPDSDNDGLPDWEEQIYGTDPSNPDSDGNGVLDGDQFESLKKQIQLELTDSVYAAVNRLGSELENMPDPTESLSLQPTFYDDRYTKADVHVTETSSTTAAVYAVKALLVLSEHGQVLKSQPLDVINHWLQTYNQDDIEKLKEFSDTNIRLSEALMEISVPEELVDVHLNVANSLYKSALALLDVEKTPLDPTAGFFAAANYANYESKYTKAVIALTDYFNTGGYETN